MFVFLRGLKLLISCLVSFCPCGAILFYFITVFTLKYFSIVKVSLHLSGPSDFSKTDDKIVIRRLGTSKSAAFCVSDLGFFFVELHKLQNTLLY